MVMFHLFLLNTFKLYDLKLCFYISQWEDADKIYNNLVPIQVFLKRLHELINM